MKESVTVKQSTHRLNKGEHSYLVEKTKNFTGVSVDDILSKDTVDKLIARGVDLIIIRS